MEQILRSLCRLYLAAVRQKLLKFCTPLENILDQIQTLRPVDPSRLSQRTRNLLYAVAFLRQFRQLSDQDKKKMLEKAARLKSSKTTRSAKPQRPVR